MSKFTQNVIKPKVNQDTFSSNDITLKYKNYKLIKTWTLLVEIPILVHNKKMHFIVFEKNWFKFLIHFFSNVKYLNENGNVPNKPYLTKTSS